MKPQRKKKPGFKRRDNRSSPSRPVPNEPSTASLEQIRQLAPDPAAPIPAVILKTRISQAAVFRKQIGSVEGAKSSDLVAVYSPAKQLIGYGLYNARSEMALRMLWRSPELPTDVAWDEKLQPAIELRTDTLNLNECTDTYRVIHAEADGLPGLMIDRFGDVLSAEAFSLGMYTRATAIMDRLATKLGTKHTLVQTSPMFLSQEGFDPPTVASPGCPSEVIVQEFGTRFKVRFEGGHKTGFFCDQSENRHKLAQFCRGKTVLDL